MLKAQNGINIIGSRERQLVDVVKNTFNKAVIQND